MTCYCQDKDWERNIALGKQACACHRFAEATKLLELSLQESESFGDKNPRLMESLKSLAKAYMGLGREADAARLCRRARELSK
jgi:hypothetical protein